MNSYYIYEVEGEQTTVNMSKYDVWSFFRSVASVIAMSDCTGQEVVKIVYDGKEYHYAGWMRGMKYTFIDNENSKNAYTVWMEHLDH